MRPYLESKLRLSSQVDESVGTGGLSTENAGDQPWLMRAGQHGAHVMIGYLKIGWKDLLDDSN